MNKLIDLLHTLKTLDKSRLEIFYPRVRDRNDIKVLRDNLTEVIVLSKSDHINLEYYQGREETDSVKVNELNIKSIKLNDNKRRVKEFGNYIRNKKWLDFGCGNGGMLDEISFEALQSYGLEPNLARRKYTISKGHKVFQNLDEINDKSLDIITLFHVFEHLQDPIGILKKLKNKLKLNGKILIEIPHARDSLFTIYDCEEFKKFTFWSEHLVLHTKESIQIVLECSGFSKIKIYNYQRYNLANHLHWLSKGKPGGQEVWNYLSSEQLDKEYEKILIENNRTDTLIAIIEI